MRVTDISAVRTQRGWVCDCYFKVYTSNQFTREERFVQVCSRWLLIALFKGYFSAWRKYRQVAASATERRERGWA